MDAKIHCRWKKDGCDVKGRLCIIYLSDNAPLGHWHAPPPTPTAAR